MSGNTKPSKNRTCCCCIDLTVGMYIILVLKTVGVIASIGVSANEISARVGTEIPNTLFAAVLAISLIDVVFLVFGWIGALKKKAQAFTAFYVYEILLFLALLGILGYYVYALAVTASFFSALGGSPLLALFIVPVAVIGVITLLWGYFLRVIYDFRAMLIEEGAKRSAV